MLHRPACVVPPSLFVLRVCLAHLLQVRVTGGIQQMLPSFLPSFLFGAPVPLDKLVLDNERGILYSLAANSAIQVRR